MSRYQIPILLLPKQTGVVFDNATSSGFQTSASSYSFSHRVGTGGTNLCLIVAVKLLGTGTVSSITYNSVGLSFVRSDAQGVYRTEIWRLVAPATGTNTVAVTLSGVTNSNADAESYTGVDQTSPIDANNGSNGTGATASASVTTLTTQDRVVGALSAATITTVTNTGGQSSRVLASGATGSSATADKGLIDTPASTTLSWTGLGVTDAWAVSLAALKPVQPVAPSVLLKDIIGCGGMVAWAR